MDRDKAEIPRRGGAQTAALIPATFELDQDDRLMVRTAGEPSLQSGDRVLSINGVAIDSLLPRLKSRVSGEREVWRQHLVVRDFAARLWYDDIRTPYTVLLSRPGTAGTQTVRLHGVTSDSLASISSAGRGPAGIGLRSRSVPHGLGYVDFTRMTAAPRAFAVALDTIFSAFTRDSIRGLVIDLRSNGGGNSALGDLLLAHVNATPYRLTARKEWKMSREYRAYLRRGESRWLRWSHIDRYIPVLGKLFHAPDGTIISIDEPVVQHAVRQPDFRGPVCVLIGPGTFSSAMMLANGIGDYHLGTLIGEETGGVPTAFGEQYSFSLPRSRLLATVSSARYIRANGDSSLTGGVQPDIRIAPSLVSSAMDTATSVATGADAALDAALARAQRCALDRTPSGGVRQRQ